MRMAASECGRDVDVKKIIKIKDRSVLSGDFTKTDVGLISL